MFSNEQAATKMAQFSESWNIYVSILYYFDSRQEIKVFRMIIEK